MTVVWDAKRGGSWAYAGLAVACPSCNQPPATCRARGGLVEWDAARKTWVCPSCETSIHAKREAGE